MKTITLMVLMVISAQTHAKNKVVGIDDVRVAKKEVVSLQIGESHTPKVSLWTHGDMYPPQVIVSCVQERVAYSSKKGKTYDIDIAKGAAYIQLRSGETVDLDSIFYHCQ